MGSFAAKLWASLKKAGLMLGGPLLALLLVVGAILLVTLGARNVQVGGVLGALLGRKRPESKALDTANSIAADRVANGKLIPIGQSDSTGMTQVAVVAIESPGIFSDPDTVKFTPPDQAKPVVVALPEGVKNSDVEHVLVLEPSKFFVTVRDSSGVTAKNVDALLAKYGGA